MIGDIQNEELWVSFGSRLKLKICGSQVTTAAGHTWREAEVYLIAKIRGITEKVCAETVLTTEK
ncbi:MAG: hypothetical protein CME32_18675 [Gimesia sp.]|nr:hypothetical protein [Gimesia sp.]